ncbi:MAG: alpha/beta hydrolase [Verrucomicrobia bacterium]|nr:alpha/beta hydrolase [Verrucomicrobiota bacterium]MBM3869430.1 alpha/beta hydrolase [Verrucomicrobiota bacterium]
MHRFLERVKKARPWLAPTVGLLVIVVMLYRFEHSQVYHPTRDAEYTPEDVGRSAEEVRLTTADGLRLHAWFFAADKASPRARLVMLFCHGNGGNLTSRPGYYRAILETGVSLLAFDYRGYGRSDGEPSELGTYADAQAAFQWLRTRGFAPEHILVWGESLGGGIASHVAATLPVGGLALQSTFTSVPDIGAELFPWLPVRLLSRISYDTHSRLPQIQCPVVILHSRADTTIRFSHGEQNFAAAREPKAFVELEGDHNDPLLANRAAYVAGAEKLVQLAEAAQRQKRSEGAAER